MSTLYVGVGRLGIVQYGNKRKKDETEKTEQATHANETQGTLYGFRGVYVFDRLSRDLRPSLCALDVIRQNHALRAMRVLAFSALNLIARRRLEVSPKTPLVFHNAAVPIGDFRKSWATACKLAAVPEKLFYDLRRSGMRDMIRARNVPQIQHYERC